MSFRATQESRSSNKNRGSLRLKVVNARPLILPWWLSL